MHLNVPFADRNGIARPRTLGFTLRAGLIVAATVCALLAQHASDANQVPGWVVAASLLAIVGSAIALPSPISAAIDRPIDRSESWRDLVPGLIVLVVPALAAFVVWNGEPFKTYEVFVHTSSSWAALFWIAGIIASLIVLGGWRIRSGLTVNRPWIWVLLEALALIVILDIATGLRLWHLGILPEGIWFDEADFATSAQRLSSMPFQPFGPGNVGHNPSLYFYVENVVLSLGGTSMGSVRLSSVIFGVLAVLTVYLLGRRAGGPALGLCAAALLGMGQWAIDFSRFGMSNIAAPATIGLGFVALALAMLRPRAVWFAAAGLALGLSLLTYAGGFIAGAGVAAGVVTVRMGLEPAFRRAAWPGVILLPVGLVVGALPWLTALWLDPAYTLARESTVSLFSEYHGWSYRITALLSNLRLHLLMFTVAGDTNGRHNLPGAPMLDAITGSCFLLGLGICLRRIVHWFYLLLLLWLVASMLGGILSLDFEAPQGARTVGATAPIALIAAMPLALLARGIWWAALRALATRTKERLKPAGRSIPSYSAIAAVILAAAATCVPLGIALADNYDGYFVRHAKDPASWNEMGGRQAIIGRAAAALLRQGFTVRVDPSLAGDPALVWATDGQSVPGYDPNVPVPLPVPAGGLALIISVDNANVLSLVRHSYPQARIVPLTPSFDPTSVQANVVLIRPVDAARNIGVTITFGEGIRAQILSHVQGTTAWPAGTGSSTAVSIKGTLLIGTAQAWQPLSFRVSGLRHGTLAIDGAAWPNTPTGIPTLRLGAGNHAFTVQGVGRGGRMLSVQWALGSSSPTTGSWAIVPALVLASPDLPSGGLLGLYYTTPQIAGQPVLERVDQPVDTYYQVPPIGANFPFSVRWLGTIRIDQPGLHSFSLDSTGASTLWIDGLPVVGGGPAGQHNIASRVLTAGLHTIRIEYSGSGSYLHCYLTWQPPGAGGFAAIPASVTEPAHG